VVPCSPLDYIFYSYTDSVAQMLPRWTFPWCSTACAICLGWPQYLHIRIWSKPLWKDTYTGLHLLWCVNNIFPWICTFYVAECLDSTDVMLSIRILFEPTIFGSCHVWIVSYSGIMKNICDIFVWLITSLWYAHSTLHSIKSPMEPNMIFLKSIAL
jgi:hypothetical protein